MLDIAEMKKLLKASLPHKRFKHSLAVYDTALELAEFYGLDKEKVGVGALLHDCGREIPTRDLLMHTITLGLPMDDVERNQPILLHAKLGVYYARQKYGVTDSEILDAIRYHTTGASGRRQWLFIWQICWNRPAILPVSMKCVSWQRSIWSRR
jgi:predicted HD superfamily hydrolase involved in NAD metabolism